MSSWVRQNWRKTKRGRRGVRWAGVGRARWYIDPLHYTSAPTKVLRPSSLSVDTCSCLGWLTRQMCPTTYVSTVDEPACHSMPEQLPYEDNINIFILHSVSVFPGNILTYKYKNKYFNYEFKESNTTWLYVTRFLMLLNVVY